MLHGHVIICKRIVINKWKFCSFFVYNHKGKCVSREAVLWEFKYFLWKRQGGERILVSPFFSSVLIALLSIIFSPHWKHLSFGIQHHCWTQHPIIYFYSTNKELLDTYEFKVNRWTYYTLLSISVPCGNGGRWQQLQYCTHIPKNLTTIQLSCNWESMAEYTHK